VWAQDEAGPYQALPQPGTRWQPCTQPARYPHEHVRHGTAKLLTLFHPASGQVRVKGVAGAPNAVLHPWLEQELTAILATLPAAAGEATAAHRLAYEQWQADLSVRFTLPEALPPLRLLLVLDNLAGHKTPSFVLWLVAHGIMPLYTPLSGSWLNMAEWRSPSSGCLSAAPWMDSSRPPRSRSCNGWRRPPTAGTPRPRRSSGAANERSAVLAVASVTTPSLAPAPAHVAPSVAVSPPSTNGAVVGVGSRRGTGVAVGPFPRPALRTGRAALTASGSPAVHAIAGLAHGVGIRVPR
jgi:hypothetical protein